MDVIGDFGPFADTFPPSRLPWLFSIIIKEWNNFSRTTRNPLENRITKPFVGHLQSCRENRSRPFIFDANVKLLDPGKDTEIGELDIRVMHGKRPKVFFAFECKRLNVIRNGKYSSLSGEYVGKDGMGCFLSGQYDGGSDCGGMIGYVMDNDVKKAISAINKALKTYKNTLKIKQPVKLKMSPLLSEKNNPCYETVHMNIENDFTIYHVILPYDVNGY
ncbi:MAG: hypothetical protein JRG74_11385 [Deltaproteobacteria bacterium]|nr:hypothetical protein [Deltaproteobacteria bacterium]